MLSVPQPEAKSVESSSALTTEVNNSVSVAEEYTTLQALFNLAYPTQFVLPFFTTLSNINTWLRAAEKYDMKIVTSKLVKEVLAQGEADPMKALEVFAMGSSLGIEELISAASKLCLRCGAKKLFELEIQGFPLANVSPPLPATGTSNDNQVATPAATPNQAPAPAVDQTADTAAAPNQDPFGNVIPVAPVPPIFQVGPFSFASIKSTQSKPSTLFDNIWQKQIECGGVIEANHRLGLSSSTESPSTTHKVR